MWAIKKGKNDGKMIISLSTYFSETESKLLEEYRGKVLPVIDKDKLFHASIGKKLKVDEPNRMVAVGGLFLLEVKAELDTWYMGQYHKGIYSFWGNYGALQDALEGL